ncbi:uncharacterized protein LOC34619968 [Cyclospora cayetanensis]|uniref:Uncharacterized protein LOC34619968 n=1 Tax=Cyclospora cayetanensis TaxID=88456 RepID=A0A6P6RUA6_9EIME|nr:uncharacterized protein LOC34619968 [Cyclospora cayetanensis]
MQAGVCDLSGLKKLKLKYDIVIRALTEIGKQPELLTKVQEKEKIVSARLMAVSCLVDKKALRPLTKFMRLAIDEMKKPSPDKAALELHVKKVLAYEAGKREQQEIHASTVRLPTAAHKCECAQCTLQPLRRRISAASMPQLFRLSLSTKVSSGAQRGRGRRRHRRRFRETRGIEKEAKDEATGAQQGSVAAAAKGNEERDEDEDDGDEGCKTVGKK